MAWLGSGEKMNKKWQERIWNMRKGTNQKAEVWQPPLIDKMICPTFVGQITFVQNQGVCFGAIELEHRRPVGSQISAYAQIKAHPQGSKKNVSYNCAGALLFGGRGLGFRSVLCGIREHFHSISYCDHGKHIEETDGIQVASD